MQLTRKGVAFVFQRNLDCEYHQMWVSAAVASASRFGMDVHSEMLLLFELIYPFYQIEPVWPFSSNANTKFSPIPLPCIMPNK